MTDAPTEYVITALLDRAVSAKQLAGELAHHIIRRPPLWVETDSRLATSAGLRGVVVTKPAGRLWPGVLPGWPPDDPAWPP